MPAKKPTSAPMSFAPPKDSNFNFWVRWLLWANSISILVGLLVAFAGDSFLFQFYHGKTATVFFQDQQLGTDVLLMQKWLFGIIGATIIGFHTMALFIIIYPFARKERWAWNALAASTMMWFIPDTALSIHYGALHNVYLINLPAIVALMLPLFCTRRYFSQKLKDLPKHRHEEFMHGQL